MISTSSATSSCAETLSPQNYTFLQQYIYRESGIVIDADKHYLFEARLVPVAREHGIATLDVLSDRLAAQSSTPLAKAVIEAMTTNETLFFRDAAMFDVLRTDLLPALFHSVAGRRRLRIWSAAASTGQEAYSLAMLLMEMGKGPSDVEIVGTDLSEQVLERAREARYVQFEVNRGLPALYLMKYFTRVGLDWQLQPSARGMARFERADLRHDLSSLGVFDLVLCRNVLIYFDTETKRRIVASICNRMLPGAALILGCAETLLHIHEGMQRRAIGQSTIYST